ncbi:MAG TPA: SPOR domain-containing protein [Gemmatimonadaceae bacterium]|nr:SPOR domain-containing protein [Gemmatimonadaceae bacterium]
MPGSIWVSAALILFVATAAEGQSSARAAEAAFARAQEMANDGNTPGGRALIDSIVRSTPPTSPIYPQALYWRATLATNAADAESDYRHIVVDYPLAPQAEDALLRLAQLELARGDRDDALAHLQRIPKDYPRSKAVARANYWIARVLFEKNDIAGACAANSNAMAQTVEAEVELRNQIQYQGQRCSSYAAAQQRAAPTSPAPAATAPPAASTTPASTPAVAEATPPVTEPAPPVAEPEPAVAAAGPVPVPETARATPPPAREASAPATRTFSVQVAAYNRKAQAEQLAATLVKRGYSARVDGTSTPYRVRIGRYASSRDAEAALKEIKARKMAGFVVRLP